jgi:AcrR family transcriptional regulator
LKREFGEKPVFQTNVWAERDDSPLLEASNVSTDDPRERILQAAGPIFADRGYKAATVREICAAAGVNLAAVNYHFGGKESLYRATVARAHPNRFEDRFAPDWPEGTPVEEKLRDFIHSMLTRLLSLDATAWEWRLLMREIMNPSPFCHELLSEHFRNGFGVLQRILDEILPRSMPLVRRQQVALSVVGQCVYYRSACHIVPMVVGEESYAKNFDIPRLTNHITHFTLAALGLAPPLGRVKAREKAEAGAT